MSLASCLMSLQERRREEERKRREEKEVRRLAAEAKAKEVECRWLGLHAASNKRFVS